MRISDWSSDVCSSDLQPRTWSPSAARRKPRRALPSPQRSRSPSSPFSPIPQDALASAPAASVSCPTPPHAGFLLAVRLASGRLKHCLKSIQIRLAAVFVVLQALPGLDPSQLLRRHFQIGRASCRERVCPYV